MFGIRKNLFARLGDRAFRRIYVREQIKQGIPAQIRAMRESRGLKQAELAALAGKAQSNIARLEDPHYGKFTLQTLLEIADAFDVWLSVEFVSFAEGLRRTERAGQAARDAPSFSAADDGWSSGLEIMIQANTGSPSVEVEKDTGGAYTLNNWQEETGEWQTNLHQKIETPSGLTITRYSTHQPSVYGAPTMKYISTLAQNKT